MKVFFKVIKTMLELFSFIAGGLFFNAVDALVFSGTTMSAFLLIKTGILLFTYFILKELISYIEDEWNKIDDKTSKSSKKKKKKKKKSKTKSFKKGRVRDVLKVRKSNKTNSLRELK